ncbi:hypothetical protein [Bacillus cereus]|uniref:Uncharacterized protein n=1 Tax=Bacillus cereus TaxID=1396 RepID=A0A2C1LQA2_BACCE|nr:hypothetical protein [Bacillus cereus]PGU00059.1 hypothetical protein COD19_17035 [Bacillus cereus]
MKIMPTEKTECFFVLDIGMEAYLSTKDPSEYLDSSDTDHLYREIVEGVYYPVKDSDYINSKKIVGFFYNEEEKECLSFYNEEFFTDAKWEPISNQFLKIKLQYDKII